jgi:hypothetical protein
VWEAITHQSNAHILQHQANAGVGFLETLEGGAVHDTGIRMREQACFVEYKLAHGSDVIERAGEALRAEKVTGFRKNALGLVTEAEERFFASGAAPLFRESENFFGSHKMRAGLSGIFSESAVTAIVAAESG